MAACDLDKYPEGSTMTQDQKDEVISMIPERIESELNGLKSGLNVLNHSTQTQYVPESWR